ncbi:MAG: GH39 family glycosyl hydrolase [Janthinobacterium lividum]
MSSLKRFVMCLLCSVALPAQQVVHINANASKSVGPYKPIYAWFGYDEANYTTAPNGQKLLREMHDLAPVPVYVRAHHLLTSGNGVPELKWSSTGIYTLGPNGKPAYDFKIVDGIFDAWKAAGVRPMVELGFMPKDLAADRGPAHEPYQVHYPKSTISGSVNNPPKDYAAWQELSRVLTAHLVQRYGREEVLRWYFEVWNEPDIDYLHGTVEEYCKLYDYAVAGVRAALPGAVVGGPATTGPSGKHAGDYLRTFLTHVSTAKSEANGKPIPLDFISFHAKGSPKIVDGKVTMGITHELQDADHGFEIVHSFPRFAHLPIILSEADPEGCAACSSKVNPANNYRNGTLYPAYTAAAYKGLFELADRRDVNLISMLSWSFEFEDKDYFEGFRSLATNGVDKPALSFFRMAGMMSGSRVAVTSDGQVPLDTQLTTGVRASADVDALATRGDHEAAVMLWNYHDAEQTGAAERTEVNITGLPPAVHRVLLQHFRIDSSHSNAYTVWQAMGSPQHPTADQQKQLEASAGLELLHAPEWMDVSNGTVHVTTDMPRESVSLLRLTW